jgi:uncharacterized protein (DUF983 family)
VPRELRADDATVQPPRWATMVKRGLRKHCPRCGAGHLFRTWWRMDERCPSCGLRFEREEGYFTGVMLLNMSVVLACLFLVTMGYMLALGANEGLSVWWPIAIGGAVAIVLPILLYPFARTTWFAIDLAMRPLELLEIAEAEEFLDGIEMAGTGGATVGPDGAELTDVTDAELPIDVDRAADVDPFGSTRGTDGGHGVGSADGDDPPGRAAP